MPSFSYKGVNDNGKIIRGHMQADNELDLYQLLQLSQIELISSKEHKEHLSLDVYKKIKNQDIIQLCLHLHQMLKAGIPFLDSLKDVRDSSDNTHLRDVLTGVYKKIETGSSLSEAFGAYPKIFGTVFVSLISVGEESGHLSDTFAHLLEHLKWKDRTYSKIKQASIYPMVMMVVLFGIFYMMMTFVVPELITFLKSIGQELPMVTLALIALSEFVVKYKWLILASPLFIFFIIKLVNSSEKLSYWKDYFLLQIPVFGKIRQKISLSRFTHFFALMFQSGVPMLKCLKTASQVLDNRYMKDNIELVYEAVRSGEALSVALSKWASFPPLVIRMVKIGEDSGRLDETLDNVTDFYDNDVNESIARMIALMAPALIIVAGSFMLWIIVGVFGPLYDSFQNLGI